MTPIRRRPLEGIRVIDATHVFAIPYATGLLADFGADVIKIHAHTRADVMTAQGPFPENDPGERPWDRVGSLNTVNRGKSSLSLDLTKPEGVEIFKRLVAQSDVVCESYTPRVMKKFGLDYGVLKTIRSDLIMLSNTGYGHSGPWNSYGSVATSLEGVSGMCWLSGYQNGAPSKISQSYTDFLACWNALYALLMALCHRQRTGEGQWIDLAMYQVGASTIGPAIMDYFANGSIQTRTGNRHPAMAPHGVFPCHGDDRWIAIAVDSDDAWCCLRHAMDEPAWAMSARFDTLPGRLADQDFLERRLADWTGSQDSMALADRLQNAGVMAAMVQGARDLFVDPHTRERGLLEAVEHPSDSGIGERLYLGRPWNLSGADLTIQRPAPTLGRHNREILSGLLGYSDADIVRFEQDAVIGDTMVGSPKVAALAVDELRKRGRIGSHDPDYRRNQKRKRR